MNKELLMQLKEKLISQKESYLLKVNKMIDIDADGDETDEIQANLLMSLANQLSVRDISKIKEINYALQKIESSVYGVCEDCEEMIPDKRLFANPCFTTCVLCAELKEVEEQRNRY